MQVRDFEPDYAKVFTASEAEVQLKDFTFLGPGWYHTRTDSLLVVPDAELADDQRPWGLEWPKDQRFWFFVYNGRNPYSSFKAVAVCAPVRQNEW